jgi:hypothetical protein
MGLVEALAELEGNDELHGARLLVLLSAFSGTDGSSEIEGLTKLAKLDFLLRYPVLLERALRARNRSVANVGLQTYERNSVESRMVRYRFGPWDHRYRRFLNLLTARGLARVRVEGRTINIGITKRGLEIAEQLVNSGQFEDLTRRAIALKGALDLTATNLMKFVYETFPELASLSMNEVIAP